MLLPMLLLSLSLQLQYHHHHYDSRTEENDKRTRLTKEGKERRKKTDEGTYVLVRCSGVLVFVNLLCEFVHMCLYNCTAHAHVLFHKWAEHKTRP